VNHGTGAPEDDTILAVIASLEKAAAEGVQGRRDEAAETLQRLYVELLGMLSYELPPLAPRPEIKQRLMAAIAGDETQEVPDPPVAAAARRASLATSAAPVKPAAPASATPASPVPAPSSASPSPHAARLAAPAPLAASAQPAIAAAPAARRAARAAEPPAGQVQVVNWRRPLPRAAGVLAAVLILALLGLSGRLGYLFLAQRGTIAALSERLQAERRVSGQAGPAGPGSGDARELRRQLDDMRDKLALATSPAVTVSALRPAGAAPAAAGAHGVLFVAADHQHWMLSVSGLPPTDPGHCYQLWFIDDAGAHGGGSFQVNGAGPVEISSPRMPPGTRDARVTVEPCPGSPAPSGPEVLAAGRFQTL
jgi:hypothetical protein